MRCVMVACWLALGALACTEQEDRPGVIEVCDSPECRPIQVVGGGSGSGGGDGAGGGSSGEPGSLSGNVAVFVDDSFDFGSLFLYSGTATVRSVDPSGRIVSGPYDGTGFTLSGLQQGDRTPVLVAPTDDNALPLPTLLGLDTHQALALTLPMVSQDILAEIYASVTALGVIDPGRAQAVYQFVDADMHPIAGVSIATSGADFVAYASGAAWSDTLDETGKQGLAVVANLPAEEFPGSNLVVTLGGAATGDLVLTVVRGAVSYELLVLE